MASRKRQLFDALIYEVRRSQNATDRFDQAVADAIGINRTDLRCLDVIQREWPVAAGRLAEQTGLTTGAITTVLDRLERAGYARRVRDPSDRRRVLVEVTPEPSRARSTTTPRTWRCPSASTGVTPRADRAVARVRREAAKAREREAAKLEERTRRGA